MCRRPLSLLVHLGLLLLCLLPGPSCAAAESDLPRGILRLNPYAAPPLSLQDMDGQPYTLRQDRGAWTFVHFWASWCGPCRREMPAIQAMYSRLQSQGLKLALVNTAEDEDTVFIFLATFAPDLRPLLDRDGQATEQWQPRGLPATYLVDPEGRVRYQALGGRPWDSQGYLDFLRRLIRAPEGRP